MSTLIAATLLLAGTAFMLIAAIGLIRLPDLYTRMHAITKAGTLGIGLVLVGVAVFFGELSVVTRAVAVILFVLLTAPVSAHMIGRAGYIDDVALWDGTAFDQWNATFEQLRREAMETEANARERAVPASDAILSDAGASDAASSDADPSDANPSDANPSDAGAASRPETTPSG